MGLFEDIPTRSNSDFELVEASWWNIFKVKLMAAFPYASGPSATFTIANNQAAYQDITGLLLDSTLYKTAIIRYVAYRKTDAPTERKEVGYLTCSYKPVATTWSFKRRVDDDSDNVFNLSVPLNIVAGTGQGQYKTDNMAGANYVGSFSWSIVATFPI